MKIMGEKLVEGFLSDLKLDDPDFDWEAVLNWEVPEPDCPRSVNATVRIHTV